MWGRQTKRHIEQLGAKQAGCFGSKLALTMECKKKKKREKDHNVSSNVFIKVIRCTNSLLSNKSRAEGNEILFICLSIYIFHA